MGNKQTSPSPANITLGKLPIFGFTRGKTANFTDSPGVNPSYTPPEQTNSSDIPLGMAGGGSKMIKNSFSELMSRSLDPSLLDSCHQLGDNQLSTVSPGILTRSLHCEALTSKEDKIIYPPPPSAPLPAATKLVPVPESLISPMVTNTPPLVMGESVVTSDTVTASKLQTIIQTAEQKRGKRPHGTDEDLAAIYIQKVWRGYRARNMNPRVQSIYQHLNSKRTYQHIQKLSEDMEATRAALDSEHKLQILQMQAINALWKKVVTLQPTNSVESIGEVKSLAQTCNRLNTQVQELQNCMQQVLRCVSPSSGNPIATQTDISALDYLNADGEKLQFNRPSSLPLSPHRLPVHVDENSTVEHAKADDDEEDTKETIDEN